MTIKEIYEVRDVSDEERYYSIGCFLSLESAIASVLKGEGTDEFCPASSNWTVESDFLDIEIIKRPIGFHSGEKVWEKSWEREYDEDLDEYLFKEAIAA